MHDDGRSPLGQANSHHIRISHKEAKSKIDSRVHLGEDLSRRSIENHVHLQKSYEDFGAWNQFNVLLLNGIFIDGLYLEEYKSTPMVPPLEHGVSFSVPAKIDELQLSLRRKIRCLRSISECIVVGPAALPVEVARSHTASKGIRNNEVFVVHGHDNSAKESMARFLSKVGLNAIILHEQASGSKTIIEKLEHHSDVGFAVVLLTPDDVGSVKGASALQPRARQNVIAELGYFVGKLGRNRVCALHAEGVDVPSDFNGVCYVPFDTHGGWKVELGRELRAAGLNVDLNKAC